MFILRYKINTFFKQTLHYLRVFHEVLDSRINNIKAFIALLDLMHEYLGLINITILTKRNIHTLTANKNDEYFYV